MPLDELVLMPEVSARRLLSNRRVLFSVLAPLGAFAGRGRLRVLRVRPDSENKVHLLCGYDAYERIEAST